MPGALGAQRQVEGRGRGVMPTQGCQKDTTSQRRACHRVSEAAVQEGPGQSRGAQLAADLPGPCGWAASCGHSSRRL